MRKMVRMTQNLQMLAIQMMRLKKLVQILLVWKELCPPPLTVKELNSKVSSLL